MTNIVTQSTPDALAAHVAQWLLEKAEAKINAGQGPFTLILSGGSTPKALYTLLAQEPFKSRFPWARTHLFFGDERFVPHTHPDSNFNMVKQSLLNHVTIPPENVHPFNTALPTPEVSAQVYENELKNFFGTNPHFDVTLLGLGEDGHTASLFPNTAALSETKSWATAVIGAKPEPRLTLTYPTLESSATIAFLIAGASKREVLQRVVSGDTSLPAANLKPEAELIYFTDQAAIE